MAVSEVMSFSSSVLQVAWGLWTHGAVGRQARGLALEQPRRLGLLSSALPRVQFSCQKVC